MHAHYQQLAPFAPPSSASAAFATETSVELSVQPVCAAAAHGQEGVAIPAITIAVMDHCLTGDAIRNRRHRDLLRVPGVERPVDEGPAQVVAAAGAMDEVACSVTLEEARDRAAELLVELDPVVDDDDGREERAALVVDLLEAAESSR